MKPRIIYKPETSTGLIDGTTPGGWYYRWPGQSWVGPWVDEETAKEEAERVRPKGE